MKFTVNRFVDGTQAVSGGLADRLKGLISLYWISKLANEQLLVDWTNPVPLSTCYRFLGLLEVDTFTLSSNNSSYLDLVDQGYHAFSLLLDEKLKLASTAADAAGCLISLLNNYEWISCNAIFQQLVSNKLLKEALRLRTGHVLRRPEDLVRIAFNEILELKNDFTFRDDLYALALFFNEVEPLKRIALHTRIGGSHVSWSDPLLDDFELIINRVDMLARKNYFSNSRVFVCSDSSFLKQKILKVLGEYSVLTFNHVNELHHVEKSLPSSNQLSSSILDFESVRLASIVIHGKGAFGRMAAYSSGAQVRYLHN